MELHVADAFSMSGIMSVSGENASYIDDGGASGGSLLVFADTCVGATSGALLASGGNVLYGPDVEGHLEAERQLLAKGVALVEGLCRLDQLTKPRVFFMALPMRIQRTSAAWTRAIALEELNA